MPRIDVDPERMLTAVALGIEASGIKSIGMEDLCIESLGSECFRIGLLAGSRRKKGG